MVNVKKSEALYSKSKYVLRKVQLKSGGLSASPKGTRYTYVYTRDHAIMIPAMLQAGIEEEAKKAIDFALEAGKGYGLYPQRFNFRGKEASYKPTQVDATGLVLIAIGKYYRKVRDKKFLKKNWKQLEKHAKAIIKNIDKKRGLVYSPNSIFEFPPLEAGLDAWVNSICYAALREMFFLGKQLGKNRVIYKKNAEKIKKGILQHMWNARTKSFLKTIRVGYSSSIVETDASDYALSYFGVLPDTDKRIISTYRRIERELWHTKLGGICRCKKEWGRNTGGFGAWALYTLMGARHFIARGNKKKADKYINWVLSHNDNLLIPEHITTKRDLLEYERDYTSAGLLQTRPDIQLMIRNSKRQKRYRKHGYAYSVTPLAWSHSEFILTWNAYKKKFLKKRKKKEEKILEEKKEELKGERNS
ncbi:MAG: hypothetical protein JW772_03600 [Candidatus Diapherotrites archaeon]|nr:hypothetical protein [Candidatus Diapherotrites archaeon]